MAPTLRQFLVRVSQDKELLDRFKSDPERTMDEGGVSSDDKAILRTRDRHMIMAAINSEEADDRKAIEFAIWFNPPEH
jgi:hypothetical protein